MRIKDVTVERTNNDKQFDTRGDNWLIALRFTNGVKLGVELKPTMEISEIVCELVKFANLILTTKSI